MVRARGVSNLHEIGTIVVGVIGTVLCDVGKGIDLEW